FLQHLGTTHALFQRWQSDKIVRGDPARVRQEYAKAFDYVRQHKDSIFGWCMLCLLQDRALELTRMNRSVTKGPEHDKPFHAELAEVFRLFEAMPALAYTARYESARSLYLSGKVEEARKQFHDLYAQTFKEETLPAIDSDFRRVMLGKDSVKDWWNEQLR